MLRTVAKLRRSMKNIRKSPRVADENMFGVMDNGGEFPIHARDIERQGRWNKGLSAIVSIFLVPFSIFSCFLQPHVHGAADALWVSGEFVQVSEINHLMVNDSMRYAILL